MLSGVGGTVVTMATEAPAMMRLTGVVGIAIHVKVDEWRVAERREHGEAQAQCEHALHWQIMAQRRLLQPAIGEINSYTHRSDRTAPGKASISCFGTQARTVSGRRAHAVCSKRSRQAHSPRAGFETKKISSPLTLL